MCSQIDPIEAVAGIAATFPDTAVTSVPDGHGVVARVGSRPFVSGRRVDGSAVVLVRARNHVRRRMIADGVPFVPAHAPFDRRGWVGVRVGAGTDWRAVGDLVAQSFRMVADRRTAALVGRSSQATVPHVSKVMAAAGAVFGQLIENKPVNDPTVIVADADDQDDLDDLGVRAAMARVAASRATI